MSQPKQRFEVGDTVQLKPEYLSENPTMRRFNQAKVRAYKQVTDDGKSWFLDALVLQDNRHEIFVEDELIPMPWEMNLREFKLYSLFYGAKPDALKPYEYQYNLHLNDGTYKTFYSVDKDYHRDILDQVKDYARKNGLTNEPAQSAIRNPQSAIAKGRQIEILLPNGEKHRAQFAIVELDSVLASHNERSFANTPGYPLNGAGGNVNDRNYAGDANAQAQVVEYARNLQPERLISTSRTPSGTPIIDEKGIVVSGNNRTMSMKLAVADYPERYKDYVKFLKEEIGAFGLSENDLSKIAKPFLVRIDYDFGAYETANLAKYNQDTKKGKRPVDKAVELSAILREKALCNNAIPTIVGEYERLSDFYANAGDQKRMVDKLVDCGILTQQELPSYYTPDFGFTANGKILLEAVLSGIVLEKDAILAGETDGVKAFRQHVVTSLPVLMANKELKADSLLPYVSEAMILQQKVVGSGLKFHDYLAQGNLFGGETVRWNEKALYLNRLLEKGQRAFKMGITKYNATLSDAGQTMGLFGDKPSSAEAFQKYVIDALEEADRRAIRLYMGTGAGTGVAKMKALQNQILKQLEKLAA